jgi:hypothetical protein
VEVNLRTRASSWAVYGLLTIPIVLILTSFPRWTVDDAYISYRYAQNLAHHGELTWNVGADPVEGYTGILMPVLLAVGIGLGFRPESIGHGIGIASFLICVASFVIFLHRLRTSTPLLLASAALLCTAPFLYTHVFSGLETMLFTALLLATFVALHRVMDLKEDGPRQHGLLAGLLLFLGLARPEGAAFAIFAIAAALVRPRTDGASRRTALIYAAVLVVPGIAYFAWRWSYYGSLLPNTYYAKRSSGISISSLRSAFHFGRDYLGVPMICTVALALIARTTCPPAGLPRRSTAVFFLFGCVVFAQYTRSELAMNYSYRFFAPFFPVALAVLTPVLGGSIARLQGAGRSMRRAAKSILAVLALAWALQLLLQVRWLYTKEMPYARGYAQLLSSEHIPAGEFLRQAVPAQELLVVFYDAGAVPYFSGLKTVDFGGLNDEYLSRIAWSDVDARVEYFYSRNPGALVFTSFDRDRCDRGPTVSRPVAAGIRADRRFGEYFLARKFACATWPDYFLLIYVRKDLLAVHPSDERGRAR